MKPIRCYSCGQIFKIGDEIYAVANLMIETDKKYGWCDWRWIKKTDSVEPVSFFYHRNCWACVAGPEYLAKNKEKEDEL